ncbi:hypothetical protein IJI31_06600 [bacterium]|nr:hypothetical protein [bacterium]
MSLGINGLNVSYVSFNAKKPAEESSGNKKTGKAKQFAKSLAGVAAGTAVYAGLPKLIKKFTKPYGLKVAEGLSNACKPYEIETVNNAVQTAFEQTGLKANGFRIHNVNSVSSLKVVSKDISEKIDKILMEKIDKVKKVLPEKLTNKIPFERMTQACPGTEGMFDQPLKMVLDGKNAFCASATKDIAVNLEKMPMATFHEMGHAVNSTTKLGKLLQASAGPMRMFAVPVILAVALLKRNKAEGEKTQGAVDKTTTFIKNNAGKLAFAAWLPTLAEEGMASIRAAKMAKGAGLSVDLLKNLNKGNAKAWTTYLIAAITTTIAVRAAVWVKDKIAESKGKKQAVMNDTKIA